MSTSKGENRKRRRANQVTVEIIRADGTHEAATVDRDNWLKQIEQLISADCLDSVDLRDGRIMFVDDVGSAGGFRTTPRPRPSTTRSASQEQPTKSKVTSSLVEMRISPEPT